MFNAMATKDVQNMASLPWQLKICQKHGKLLLIKFVQKTLQTWQTSLIKMFKNMANLPLQA